MLLSYLSPISPGLDREDRNVRYEQYSEDYSLNIRMILQIVLIARFIMGMFCSSRDLPPQCGRQLPNIYGVHARLHQASAIFEFLQRENL